MDLGDIGAHRFSDLKSGKEKGRFFLLCIDIFSKRLFACGLPNKSAVAVLDALNGITDTLHPPYTPPVTLECDRGREFENSKVLDWCKSKKVRLKAARGGNKARTVEKAIRSFKKVLIPFLETNPNASWPEAVQKVAKSLNGRYNRSIHNSPDQVESDWEQLQQHNVKEKKRKPFLSYLGEQLEIRAGKPVIDGRQRFAIGNKVIVPYSKRCLTRNRTSSSPML